MDPTVKRIFGFDVEQVIQPQGLHQMAVLIHGNNIIQMLNTMLSVLGPDTEMLQDVLLDIGERQSKLGLSPSYFRLLCRAVLEVLREAMDTDWTAELKEAWFQVIRFLSLEILKAMQKQMSETCDPVVPTQQQQRYGDACRFTLKKRMSSRRKKRNASSCMMIPQA